MTRSMLVIEDREDKRHIMRNRLTSRGYEVIEAFEYIK